MCVENSRRASSAAFGAQAGLREGVSSKKTQTVILLLIFLLCSEEKTTSVRAVYRTKNTAIRAGKLSNSKCVLGVAARRTLSQNAKVRTRGPFRVFHKTIYQ